MSSPLSGSSVSLPGVHSPKKRERTLLGVSNKHGDGHRATQAGFRLCRMNDPRATVDASFMNNFDDQRYIHTSLRESNMLHAPDHHSYSIPPPLPVTRDAFGSMRHEPPAFKTLAPPKAPAGIPALLRQNVPDTLSPLSSPNTRGPPTVRVTPRRHSTSPRSTWGSTEQHVPTPPTSFAASAETRKRPTAAQAFLQGDLHVKPSTYQAVLGPPLACNPRSGATGRPDTLPLTQAAPGTGSYAAPETRFDANTRGLYISRVAQEDKLRAHVAQEVKTAIRRDKEASVIASRVADGERGLRIDAGRIRSKALQRSQYQDRLASYKFTK